MGQIMNIFTTDLDGVLIIEPKVFGDHRGFFTESYSKKQFEEHGIDSTWIQDNHSLSAEAGTLRGLHYQLEPKAQTKLVRVIQGAVMDVAVDIRQNSPTFGKHVIALLTSSNFRQILIPKGFAHGFITLVENTQVIYKVDEFYAPECDRGILWSDLELKINWHWSHPILSDKDAKAPLLKDAEINFS